MGKYGFALPDVFAKKGDFLASKYSKEKQSSSPLASEKNKENCEVPKNATKWTKRRRADTSALG